MAGRIPFRKYRFLLSLLSYRRRCRPCGRKTPVVSVVGGDKAVVTAFPGATRIKADRDNSGPVYIGMSEEELLKQEWSLYCRNTERRRVLCQRGFHAHASPVTEKITW